jgi:pimeloyl-ACP methyl ester carboxylesterase
LYDHPETEIAMKRIALHISTRRSLFLLASVLLLGVSSALSQVNKLDPRNLEETMRNPWNPNQGGFLQDWLLLGSIPINGMDDIEKDFLSSIGGEANVQPTEGVSVTVGGTEMKWKSAHTKDIIDLQGFYRGGRTEDALAYAYTTVHRNEAGKVFLTVGSDDAVKIWLNGKLVHRVLRHRAVSIDEDRVDVNMNAGDNRLLLKIEQSKGGWGFVVRMIRNPSILNILTGNIEFSVSEAKRGEKSLKVTSDGNLDQNLLKQTVQMEVFTTGGKTVATKKFQCGEPVMLNYANWPDGVYEFRYTYTDIRGTKFVKYNSWYKGDILAAARALVKSAPGKDARTPEAATHRMLADMVLDRLGNNPENPDSAKLSALHSPLMEFAEIKAGNQVRAGGFVRLAYIDEIDNTPQFCRSYLPLHYDKSKKWPLIIYLHGFNGDNPEYINWWSVDKRHDGASDLHGAIYIEPHGRGNTSYLGIGDRDVLRCIEMAKKKFNVDNDRVYLMGGSMGGFGTWNVATRHPELFAAIAPIYGGGDYHVNTTPENIREMSPWQVFLNDKSSSTAQLEALLNIPILVQHGDQDQSVDVNLSRYLVRMLQRWNYDVRYIEVPGKGHIDLGLTDQTVDWMLSHKRNGMPQHVRVRAADLQTASAYWVKATRRASPIEFMEVDAEALEGNLIRVDSKNVVSLSLTPDKPLIDRRKPVRVVWNGGTKVFNNVRTGSIELIEEGIQPAALSKSSRIAGPIADFFDTPFMIVIGTTSADSVARKIIAQKAETIVGDWKRAQKYEPRVKKDVEVTEADMKQYSLFLLGGPGNNTISGKVFEKIPIRLTSDEITVGGRTFKAENATLVAVYPNPFNPGRYVMIAAGTSGRALAFFDPRRQDLYQYDFYVNDGRMPVYSAGATNEKIMLAAGFFDADWKLDGASLTTGDESLRSQCPYTVVRDDLSTEVVSAAKPSMELLQSYEGTYQILNGPQVSAVLENGMLMAKQGQFSARMVAVSEKEFYIREVNASVAFEKEEGTDDVVMTVYQGGQKFASRRVK